MLSQCNDIISDLEERTNDLGLAVRNALIKKFLRNHQVQSQYRANLNRRALDWRKEKKHLKSQPLVSDIFPPELYTNNLFESGK